MTPVSTTVWKRLAQGPAAAPPGAGTPPGCYEAVLPGGRFRFDLELEEAPFRELCDVALRNNARRRFLFVSRVLGRHWPARPAAVRAAARALALKLRARLTEEPVVFFGMAETATTLGQAVFREWLALGGRGVYVEGTRRPTGGPVAFTFQEAHSHAQGHLLHLPEAGADADAGAGTGAAVVAELFTGARQAVIVDDEATTAATAAALAAAWRGLHREPEQARVVLAVLLHWHNGPVGLPAGLDGLVSLAAGRFEFEATGSFPPAAAAQAGADARVRARRGARHGVAAPEEVPAAWLPAAAARPGERVLVLGNGEFGFVPLRLAEELEAAGAVCWVQATTRSPILPGGAVGHVRSFPALSGEPYVEFLYNVPDAHEYDRVILCLEDAAPEPGHPLLAVPRLEVRTLF